MKTKHFIIGLLFIPIIVLFTVFIKKIYYNKENLIFKFTFNNDEIISLYNLSNENVSFNFKLNNLFFSSIKDITEYALKDSSYNEPYMKLFNFITNSLVKNSTFNSWDISPLTIINSTGYALCGKQSALYGLLCKNAGYKAKLVKLDGHVICEIKDKNNKKILVDVSHKHLFKINNTLLSYEDIINKPFYLTQITDSLNSYIANYSSLKNKYLEIFLSTKNNTYENIQWKFKDTFLITLPPNSSFSLPYKPNYYKDIFPYNTKAKLKLYSIKEYEINNNNLIIIDIEGKGKVKVAEKTFTLPEERDILQFHLLKYTKKFFKIKVLPYDTNFAIVYALNPAFTKLKNINEVIINSNKPLKIKRIKNKHNEGDFEPIHIQWLNNYSYNILNFFRNHKTLKLNKLIDIYPYVLNKIYCVENNTITDSITFKNRLLSTDSIINKYKLKIQDEDKIFIIGTLLYINNTEFFRIRKQIEKDISFKTNYDKFFRK